MSFPDERGGSWTLLTGHGHVLVEIARNPQARIRHIAPLFEAAPAVVDLLTVSGANPGAVVTRQRARRDGLGTSPASNLTANASEGEFRSPGHRKARQPPRRRCVSARMARAAHPSTRRFRPAMALPGASAL